MPDLTTTAKPIPGRLVLYHQPPPSAADPMPPKPVPALIQSVAANGTVRLCVFGTDEPFMVDALAQGDRPRQWAYPPQD